MQRSTRWNRWTGWVKGSIFAAMIAMMLAAAVRPAEARDKKTVVGGEVVVPYGQTANDIACVFCRVIVHGDVNGDVAVAFGSVSVDDGRMISGDVAIFSGDLYLGRDARVNGDLALAAGTPTLSEGASVGGSRAVMPGRAWLLAFLSPILILIGIIWLAVYLVRRNRYQFPAYPPPTRRP